MPGLGARVARLSCVLAATGAALCALAAGPAAAARVRGPHTVRPGHRVTFRLSRIAHRSRLDVTAQPWSCRDSNGCGVAIGRHRNWRTSPAGRIRLRFRWPRRFYRCLGAGHCHGHRWGRHRFAQIAFCTRGRETRCLRYRVRVRHADRGGRRAAAASAAA